jgi:hypothetical protein
MRMGTAVRRSEVESKAALNGETDDTTAPRSAQTPGQGQHRQVDYVAARPGHDRRGGRKVANS